MITEEFMLLYALGSMYFGSLVVALSLHLAGAQPLIVVIGGTLFGAIIYTAICLLCGRCEKTTYGSNGGFGND